MGLTFEEKVAVKGILDSEGWKALRKAMDAAIEQARGQCENVREDHRFYQGLLLGMRKIVEFADSCAKVSSGISR
jgi:hypothetical protein